MKVTTPGKLLVEDIFPPEYRDEAANLTKKDINRLFTQIARTNPDQYPESLRRLVDVGREVVSRHGREASIGLSDLKLPPELERWRNQIRDKAEEINNNPGLSPEQRQKRLVEMLSKTVSEAPKRIVDTMRNTGNAFVSQQVSGARGNPSQLMQLLFGDVMVIDARDKPVPIPVLRGYGEGVRPMEYWAASSGARKGSVAVQFSTAQGGYLGKQLSNIGHRVVVTTPDCGTSRGYPADPDDPDNIGAVLAQGVGKYAPGEIITRNMLGKLGDKPIQVRSVITCEAGEGVCSKCCGIREKGTLPPIGEQVGVVSTRALSEPITQSGLGCLHPMTEVLMADGSVRTLQSLRVGDVVTGCGTDGRLEPTTVLDVMDKGFQDLYVTVVKVDGELVEMISTLDHKVLSPEGTIDPIQDKRISAAIEDLGEMMVIDAEVVEQYPFRYGRSMDIEVDHHDNLFVLANGLVVSNSKHTGGVAGVDDKKVSGFKEMDQFLQVPQNFQGGSVLSPRDGVVTKIEAAPAGGSFIYVNGEPVYVPKDRAVTVKGGDRITAGDMLSDGVPNPAEIARYKGIGEARRYFVDEYAKILKRNSAGVHRRNLEVVARGFINRINIKDVDGYNGYMMGDVVPYDDFASGYQPRSDSREQSLTLSRNHYLEKPYLHYTIGTRITPSVYKNLQAAGIKDVIVNDKEPVFDSMVVRSRSLLASDPDWMTRMSGEGLKKSTLQSAQHGASSTPASTSYFPAVANPSALDKYKGGTPQAGPPRSFVEVK